MFNFAKIESINLGFFPFLNRPTMIKSAVASDFPAMIHLWELSVRATHDFLPEDYLQEIKKLLPSIFPVVDLFVFHKNDGTLAGFLGVAGKKIEMLFIDPASRGQGIGKELLRFAIQELHVDKVDVNEQNRQATGFYQHLGFSITGRSDTDGLGKPFPLLMLELKAKAD